MLSWLFLMWCSVFKITYWYMYMHIYNYSEAQYTWYLVYIWDKKLLFTHNILTSQPLWVCIHWKIKPHPLMYPHVLTSDADTTAARCSGDRYTSQGPEDAERAEGHLEQHNCPGGKPRYCTHTHSNMYYIYCCNDVMGHTMHYYSNSHMPTHNYSSTCKVILRLPSWPAADGYR